MKIAKEVFLKLGISEADADKYLSSDEAVIKELKVDEITKTIFDKQIEKANNDGTISTIVGAKIGEVLGARDNKIMKEAKAKGVVITDAEYQALPQKDRTDKLIEFVVTKLAEKTSSGADDKDKEIARLNKEFSEAQEKIKKLEEEELPKAKTEAEKLIESMRLETQVDQLYLNTLKGKLIADEVALKASVMSKVTSEYDIRLKDGKLAVFNKGKETLAYEGSNPLSVEKLLSKSAEELKLVKTQDPPPRKEIKTGNDGDEPTPTHLKNAQRVLEKKKAEIEANKQ